MMTQDAFLKTVAENHPKDTLDLLAKAYHYSERAHRGQQRKSGSPFFIHPVEVGLILNEMKLDLPSIIAGLLHDTVEDTETKLDTIRKEFSPEIAFLVDGVTKLDKIVFTSREDKQAENFRKMIMAMAQDIRVLLIKLADRLSNMRSIRYLSRKKQEEIAQETLDIYAPLANRLGMSQLKMELQDLSMAALKPDIISDINRKIKIFSKNKQTYIRKVERKLHQKLSEALPRYEISHRLKHAYSIYHKMEAQNLDFEQVHDIVGFRVLVNTLEECYETLGIIHSLWTPIPGRIKDYIAMPKANRYQSLHTTVICEDGYRVEFQIRTFAMHEIAEQGIAAHWHYKEGHKLGSKDTDKFQWLRQLLNWKEELDSAEEFLDTVKLDLFTNEVYVFTPRGDVKELPYGSTPIDLAYTIHSDIGDRCAGARVNDRIVPLSYTLKSGDVVEILTNPTSHPNRDWLKFAKTSRAKAHVRRVIRQEQRSRSIALGRELLEKECDRFDLNLGRILKSKEMERVLQGYKVANVDSLLAALGYGKVSPSQLLGKLFPKEELAPKEAKQDGLIQQIFKKVASKSRSLVKVSGLDDVLVMFGKCCHPLPGDSITGFITRGRGVTVHTKDCPKVLGIDKERCIDVTWDNDRATQDTRNVKVKILSQDRPGLLSEISTCISDRGLNIASAQIRTTRDAKAVHLIELAVPHLDKLQSVMQAIQRIDGVITIERLRG